MRTITVTSPDGTAWQVRVVWQPRWRALARRYGGWRRRKRRNDGYSGDFADAAVDVGSSSTRSGGGSAFGDDLIIGIAIVLGFILGGVLIWFLLIPLMLLLVDVIVVVALFAAAIPARVLLRRPWTVEATRRHDHQRPVTMHVVGWRAALQARDELAQRLQLGLPVSAVHTPPHR